MSEKTKETQVASANSEIKNDLPESPTGLKVIAREFRKDKLALVSLIFLVTFILIVFIWASFLDEKTVMRVNILNKFLVPGEDGYWLGTDMAGRSILGQLILGARNSIAVAISITFITMFVGIVLGISAGYFGGIIDKIIMQIIDFISILPMLMIIIVFVTLIPNFKMWHFISVLSVFFWISSARLVRAKTLSEARRDYVSASKTMGTTDFKIMFKGILPNISSIIVVDFVLTFAYFIGIETALSFLGFGFPPDKGSLGTLIAFARNSEVLLERSYIWLPASILIFVMMLSINYIGQALRRASDAKQRLG